MDQVKHIFREWSMSAKNLKETLEKMRPPSPINIKDFYGTWYNVEAMPQGYDNGCTNSSGTYSDDHKGGIHIDNKCMLDGKWWPGVGTAHVTSNDGSQFKAVFDYHGLSTPPFQLCIIRVSGTLYAMMGMPTLDGLWFMSRTPQPLPSAVNLEFRSVAAQLGFDLSKMVKISHDALPQASVLAQTPL